MKAAARTLAAAATILIMVLGLASLGPAQENNKRRSVNVSVMKVRPTPIKDVLILPGSTQPWQDVTVAADQDGRVEWVGPSEGDRVKTGDLIAKIDVSMLKAQLDNAVASYKLAEDLYNRRKRLFERKIISQEELEQARTEMVVREGVVRQTRVQYQHGFVKSPMDGVVNNLLVDAGEFVPRGGPVADLVNVDKIEINVNVPELDVNYLQPGGPAMFRVDAVPDRDFAGVIDFIALKADPATKTFRVKVLVENPEHLIRPGMIVRIAFLRRVIPDAVAVPLFALVDKGGERIVFVEEDGVAHSRTVSLGIIEGDLIQVTKGLDMGENLIVTGQTELEDGIKVIVK